MSSNFLFTYYTYLRTYTYTYVRKHTHECGISFICYQVVSDYFIEIRERKPLCLLTEY